MENVFNDYNTNTTVQVHKVENKDEFLKVEPVEEIVKQYPFFQNIKYFTAFALTIAILQQPVLNLTSFRTSSEISKNQIDYKDTANIYESETSVFSSTSHSNFPIEREGDFTLTDDIRQKDIDNLQKNTDIKIKHLDTKIKNIDENISEIKAVLNRMEEKFDNLPSRDYIDSKINENTNRFLLWLGGGLLTTGILVSGFLAWFINFILSNQ